MSYSGQNSVKLLVYHIAIGIHKRVFIRGPQKFPSRRVVKSIPASPNNNKYRQFNDTAYRISHFGAEETLESASPLVSRLLSNEELLCEKC